MTKSRPLKVVPDFLMVLRIFTFEVVKRKLLRYKNHKDNHDSKRSTCPMVPRGFPLKRNSSTHTLYDWVPSSLSSIRVR